MARSSRWLAFLVAAHAGCGWLAPPADDEDAGLVQIVGGDYDGWWMLDGTSICSNDGLGCSFATPVRGLRIDGLREGQASFHAVVGDAGPGASTVSADGGTLVFEWPEVEGRSFAAPAVGEELDVRLVWTYLGEGCPVGGVEVYSAAGRLLVSQGYNAWDGAFFRLSDEPTDRACSYPVGPEVPRCCCGSITPVYMDVAADSPIRLAECAEAELVVGGQPFLVQVWGAARARMPPCGDDGDWTRASAFGVALLP